MPMYLRPSQAERNPPPAALPPPLARGTVRERQDFSIKNMTLEDFKSIENSLLTDFDDFWQPETLKDELMNKSSKYIAAKEGQNNILGFAGIWNGVYDFHITDIAVRKDLRNQGIGSMLLEKLIELAKQNKMETITLEVLCTNTPAIKLYEKFGFKNAGIRKNYYKGTQDAFIMTLNLM